MTHVISEVNYNEKKKIKEKEGQLNEMKAGRTQQLNLSCFISCHPPVPLIYIQIHLE